MKTITATFHFANGSQARAVGTFATLPGEGAVEWSGNTAELLRVLPDPFNRELHTSSDAATFADSMRGLAERSCAGLSVTSHGTWQEFEE